MGPSIPLFGILAVTGLSFVSFLVSPFVAWSKGYAPYLWLFACGPVGLVVIACLPSARKASTPELMELMQTRGNTTGAILTGVGLVVGLMLAVPAVLLGI
ncbi:MAG: hypothetical protein JSS49_19740 [Planctomycetes bacterium]|nr:hypothetical protein [Planctomycetota bacterium]